MKKQRESETQCKDLNDLVLAQKTKTQGEQVQTLCCRDTLCTVNVKIIINGVTKRWRYAGDIYLQHTTLASHMHANL